MTASTLIVLATEGGIPTSNPWSQIAVPLGIVIFVGSVYMLLRSNLGTRRGYLVMSTSLWGFGFLISLFWAFGAPGTPPNTGPQNLPGQELDAYQPVWRAFAEDSALATEEGSPYAAAAAHPDGWGPVPADFQERADTGVVDIGSFFSGLTTVEGVEPETYRNVLTGTEVVDGDVLYAEAENGRPMIAATFAPTCQFLPETTDLPPYCVDAGLEIGDPVPADAVDGNGNPAGERVLLFAFFDAGAPYFPSLLMVGIMFVLFALHMLLLARDEQREQREARAVADETAANEPRATVSV